MDNNGQLSFSDDPLLDGTNNVYQLIEQGKFNDAVKVLDELMSVNPDYPGIIDAYRIAKFWDNRTEELQGLNEGKQTADFLMKQWDSFTEYAKSKNIQVNVAYNSSMHFIFFKASEHYKIAFKNREDTANNFALLLNLGICFLRLEEYKHTIETLEYARSSFKSNAQLLAILGEAYYHIQEVPKSLICFKEAFFINASEIDIHILHSEPITKLHQIATELDKNKYTNEWIPVLGFIYDIFYVRKNISRHQVENIEKDIYNLELSYQKMNKEEITNSKLLPRLMVKYLWMLDYYEFQNYNFDNITEIRDRLLNLDKELFQDFFKNRK